MNPPILEHDSPGQQTPRILGPWIIGAGELLGAMAWFSEEENL